MLDITQVHATRRALEQDGSAVLHQRQCRHENHNGNAHTNAGISVVASFVAGKPDDGGGDDDSDVVESIADDVNQNPQPAQITARALKLDNVVPVLRVGVDRLQIAS